MIQAKKGMYTMPQIKLRMTFLLSLLSSILIIFNGVWIFTNGGPIVLSSFGVSSLEEITNAEAFWGRIAFGIPGLVEGFWVPLWLLFAVATLICSLLVYRNPRRHPICGLLTMIFSLLSLPIGGGFYVGSILGFVGGAASLEWKKPFMDTFFGKLLKAATFNSEFYSILRERGEAIGIAAFTVLFIGTLSGIGNGVYTYNANLIREGGAPAFEILLRGSVMWTEKPFVSAISFIGVSLVKWLMLSFAIYWIGAKLTSASAEYNEVARTTAFAYVPEILLVFMPLMFSNEPTLSSQWPLGLYVVSRLWAFAILVVASGQALGFSRRKALGVAFFGGTLYWLAYHLLVVPTFNVPGIELKFAMPESSWIILSWVTGAAFVAMLFGVFREK